MNRPKTPTDDEPARAAMTPLRVLTIALVRPFPPPIPGIPPSQVDLTLAAVGEAKRILGVIEELGYQMVPVRRADHEPGEWPDCSPLLCGHPARAE